ncbi:hypothetical protein KPH14_005938 [Odynerus spinipes]|uniref:Uncharacterized protein n=1 Tax=Odynerus spinipes TaxID=1348599 RepID=A0AAD9VNH9_9HYME|nr:hypothetical protein KPH14_005938 [Odynerus spinipes]
MAERGTTSLKNTWREARDQRTRLKWKRKLNDGQHLQMINEIDGRKRQLAETTNHVEGKDGKRDDAAVTEEKAMKVPGD